jgi:proteasome lid subunit RPN8/RPN11
VVAVRDGAATEVRAATNAAASPMRFEVDAQELYRLMSEIEDRGDELGAIYHSHTRSAPEPSQTDVNFAALWPGVEWIIVGTQHEEPEVRTFRIDEGRVTEVELEVR